MPTKIGRREVTPKKSSSKGQSQGIITSWYIDLSADDVMLILPAIGREYRKPEVLKILSSYTRGTKQISSVMNKMIELKYVPCGIHTLHCLIVSATKGEQPVLDTD
jgi:hypothetical protein